MRTYKLSIAADIKAIIPESWVKLMREQAQAPDATAFLQRAQEMHPEDDDEFILLVVTNGVRMHVRQGLVDLFASSGLGCTISPVAAKNREFPVGATPILASEVQAAIPDALPDSLG